jgi:hypothetical protein
LKDAKAEIERLTELQSRGSYRVAELGIENAELQKQVDELKSQNEWLTNEKDYLKQCADAFLGDYKNSVKGTAKEILTGLIEKAYVNECIDLTVNEVKAWFREDYGVEVE